MCIYGYHDKNHWLVQNSVRIGSKNSEKKRVTLNLESPSLGSHIPFEKVIEPSWRLYNRISDHLLKGYRLHRIVHGTDVPTRLPLQTAHSREYHGLPVP